MTEVTIYTDGACKGNPGPGGWGQAKRWPLPDWTGFGAGAVGSCAMPVMASSIIAHRE